MQRKDSQHVCIETERAHAPRTSESVRIYIDIIVSVCVYSGIDTFFFRTFFSCEKRAKREKRERKEWNPNKMYLNVYIYYIHIHIMCAQVAALSY